MAHNEDVLERWKKFDTDEDWDFPCNITPPPKIKLLSEKWKYVDVKFEGKKIMLPAGMDYDDAIFVLEKERKKEQVAFSNIFINMFNAICLAYKPINKFLERFFIVKKRI